VGFWTLNMFEGTTSPPDAFHTQRLKTRRAFHTHTGSTYIARPETKFD